MNQNSPRNAQGEGYSYGFNPNASPFDPNSQIPWGQAPRNQAGGQAPSQPKAKAKYATPRQKKKTKQTKEAERKLRQEKEANEYQGSGGWSMGNDLAQAMGDGGYGYEEDQAPAQYDQLGNNHPSHGQPGGNFAPYSQPVDNFGQLPLPRQGQGMFAQHQMTSNSPYDYPNDNSYNNDVATLSSNKKQKKPRTSIPVTEKSNAPPSLASGGIPEPSAAYLLRSSFIALGSAAPRPLLVVLDLNGTLLYRPKKKNSYSFITRPFARQFLTYVIDTFTVVIWSSARPENVSKMCDVLLTPEQKSRVVAIWGRDKFGLTRHDYNSKVQVYKRLTKIWEDPGIAASYPVPGRGAWNQGNTVLIDDSIEKARSEPYNAITIPEFTGADENGNGNGNGNRNGNDQKDELEDPPVLPMVHEYLNKLAMRTDVSAYIRKSPFSVHDEALRIQAGFGRRVDACRE